MATTLIVVAALVALNGLLAAYELALASVSVNRLRALADQKRRGAVAALAMKQRMEASLAAVQLGITLVGAIAAAVGGASTDEALSPMIEAQFGVSPAMAEAIAITAFVIPLASLQIVVGELIPKVIALKNPDRVACTLSPAMAVFFRLVFPAVWIFEKSTQIAVRLLERGFSSQNKDEHQESLAELRSQVNVLRASRVIGVQEERIILGASKLSSLKVRDIMLPAEEIVMLNTNASLAENIMSAHLDAHTRFPVTEQKGNAQSIVGYVNFKEMIFLAKMHPINPTLREITRPLISLPADLPVSEALRRMVAEHLHLALVRDAGGTVLGMITQEDIFEELVGDIEDEFDRLPRHVTPTGRQWIVGGGATLSRLRQVVNDANVGGELPGEVTVNEWLRQAQGRTLRGGDVVHMDGVHVLVRKVRRQKVMEALVESSARQSPRPAVATAEVSEIAPPGTP